MNATTIFSTLLNIAATICIFFAAPIVMPVSGLLGVLLVVFGCLFALGVITQIYEAYRPKAS